MINSRSRWFDGDIVEKLSARDKSFMKFEKSKLHIDREIFEIAQYIMQKSIWYKKKTTFENRISDSKKFCKAFKSLGLPNKTSAYMKNYFTVSTIKNFITKLTLYVFKNYNSNLPDNLFKNLTASAKKILLTL